MGCFRAVPVQARSKMRAVPYSPSCWNSRHNTAFVFVSCRHGPKYFMPCRALGRAKWSCRGPPKNDTAQVPALEPFNLFRLGPHPMAEGLVIKNHGLAALIKLAAESAPRASLCSSASSQQYFCLTPNQHQSPAPASQQYFSLTINQHQPPATVSRTQPLPFIAHSHPIWITTRFQSMMIVELGWSLVVIGDLQPWNDWLNTQKEHSTHIFCIQGTLLCNL